MSNNFSLILIFSSMLKFNYVYVMFVFNFVFLFVSAFSKMMVFMSLKIQGHMPGDTNHLKSGTYCFLVKHSAFKRQSLEQFVSCYKWRCRVLGESSPDTLKDPTSLKEIG